MKGAEHTQRLQLCRKLCWHDSRKTILPADAVCGRDIDIRRSPLFFGTVWLMLCFLRKICNKKSYPRYWTPVCCSVKTWTTHYHKKSALSHTVQTHTSVSKDSKVNRVNHCSWSVLSYNSSIFNWTVTSSLVFGRSLMTILSQAPPGGGILKLRNPDLPQKISAFFIPYW
jgi:hypothetical protein